MLKVVIHLDESEKWQVAIANVTNLINDVGPEEVNVVVLANGGAVELFRRDTDLWQVLEQLKGKGAGILACRNSLRSLSIEEGSLPSFITVVPAGITELVRRQHDGWAYVRP